jgi:hypothetical protein
MIQRQNSRREQLGIQPAKPADLDEEALENLRALGYIN